MDDACGVDCGRRKRGTGEEGEADSERVRDRRGARIASAESRGRMEIDSQSSAEALLDSTSGRGRQEGFTWTGTRKGTPQQR